MIGFRRTARVLHSEKEYGLFGLLSSKHTVILCAVSWSTKTKNMGNASLYLRCSQQLVRNQMICMGEYAPMLS